MGTGIIVRDISESRGISGDNMAKAGVVLDWSDLLPQVLDGTLALDAAYQTAKDARDQAGAEQHAAQAAAERLADLLHCGPASVSVRTALANLASRVLYPSRG